MTDRPRAPDMLELRVQAARAVLWIEALSADLWPAICLVCVLAAAALFGLPALLPWPLHLAGLLAALVALALLMRPLLTRLRPPRRYDAERRLEHDSRLPHRPFATLRDVPSGHGPADALWARHQARARAALCQVRLAPPRPDLARHDPRALRLAGLILLAAGLVVAGPRAASRLLALLPGVPSWQAGAAPVIQAWVQPPAYTGLPPIFLAAGGSAPEAPVAVPTGSRLTLSITGLSARPGLSLAADAVRVERLGGDSFQAAAVLAHGGRLRLTGRFSTLAAWTLTLLPNEPPAVAWRSPPGRAGSSLSTSLPWQVRQRWGVAGLEAVLRPQGRADLPPVHLRLPLPGTPRQAGGSAVLDLSADPYAGLVVTARLEAQDVSGQHGQSSAADFVLPARQFRHKLARAIADFRRRLALHPDQGAALADELQALAEVPLGDTVAGLSTSGVALNLSADAARLADTRAPADAAMLAEVQGRLWTLALALDGALPDAASWALAEARDNLRRGIEDHAHGALSDKDLAKRLDALRDALDKRLADLARRAVQQGALKTFDPQAQHLSAPALDRAISKLEQALREGRTKDAQARMAELERMMDQLKNAHIMTKEEAQAQRAQAKSGRQQMGAVQDMVQRETTLLDHQQARAPGAPQAPPPPFGLGGLPPGLADQLEQPQQDGTDGPAPNALSNAAPPRDEPGHDAASAQQGAGQPAVPPRAAPAANDDARTQRALRRALGALKDGLAQTGRKKPASLDDADHAMEDAAKALASAQDPQARDAIARAIAALQQGGQDMARQGGQQAGASVSLSLDPGGQRGSKAGGSEEGQDEPGDEPGGRRRDPFGRPVDGTGTTADDPGLRVPDDMEQGRSRAIQEELRRRGSDRARSQGELDYIGRLLKPF